MVLESPLRGSSAPDTACLTSLRTYLLPPEGLLLPVSRVGDCLRIAKWFPWGTRLSFLSCLPNRVFPLWPPPVRRLALSGAVQDLLVRGVIVPVPSLERSLGFTPFCLCPHGGWGPVNPGPQVPRLFLSRCKLSGGVDSLNSGTPSGGFSGILGCHERVPAYPQTTGDSVLCGRGGDHFQLVSFPFGGFSPRCSSRYWPGCDSGGLLSWDVWTTFSYELLRALHWWSRVYHVSGSPSVRLVSGLS